jgi:hypothetical protein
VAGLDRDGRPRIQAESADLLVDRE